MNSKTKEIPESQVWLITGSSRGLGRALAGAVLGAGHKLVATARNPAQLSDLTQRYGDRVRAVALDVTDERAAERAVKAATNTFGRLDVLVNNAGYGDISSIEDTSLADFRAQIETNLFGVIIVTKAAIAIMRRQRMGHIIQFSSIDGRIGPPGRAAYAAAKWGVEGFSEDGPQPGNPEKAAAVVLRVAAMANPPLRLLLGSDAVQAAERSALARIEADKKWRG